MQEEGSASPWLSRFSESLIAETPGIERERGRENESDARRGESPSFYRFVVIRIPALVFDENSNSPIKGYCIFFIIEENVWLSK